MAVTDLRIDIASQFTGKAAFNQADQSTKKLNQSVKSLAKNLGIAFGGAQLTRYATDAVKAFAADDKAARMLTQSLENLGLGFKSTGVANFISEMERTYGVLDDQLRPAFQKLLTTTGSVTESQKILKTALNLSAASGADLESVSADLSKAYVGQTRALAKYGLGLSQAELKAMSFEDIQKRVNTLFGGQAILAVNSYSGAIAKLSVAAGNAQETIGKGLVDAIIALNSGTGGAGGGIDEAVTNIDKLSEAFSKFLVYGAKFNKLFFNLGLGTDKFRTTLNDPREFTKSDPFAAFGGLSPEAARGQAMGQFYQAKRVADLKKLSDAKALAAAKKLAAAEAKAAKDKLALSKIGSIFEMDKIQIIAALQGKISQEERTRLELQLAILTGNVDEATRLTNQLAESQGLSKELAAFLKTLPDANNPFTAWETYLAGIEARVRSIINLSAFANNPNLGGSVGSPVIGSVSEGIGTTTAGQAAQLYGGMGPAIGQQPVYVNVQIAGEDVNAIVTGGLQNQSLSGQQAFINRIYGQFGG